MKKVLIFLGVSLLLSTSEVHATTFGVELIEAQLLNSQGASIATVSGTVTGTYDDATGIVTMDAGTTVFSWFAALTPVYSDSHANWSTGAASYSTTDYDCIEGTFGSMVGAHICGNYTFGDDHIDDSSVDYSTIPGTRTILSDDVAVGAQLQGDDWATSTVSFVPGSLIMQTADWNGFDTGRQLTFTVDTVDTDEDGVPDSSDNCPDTANPLQEDTYPPGGNGIGDACDCEADFTCDGDVDADDVTAFLADFGREEFYLPCTNAEPCNGDFDCDVDVDAGDVTMFLEDFGREEFYKPCPPCDGSPWCTYTSSTTTIPNGSACNPGDCGAGYCCCHIEGGLCGGGVAENCHTFEECADLAEFCLETVCLD